MQTSQDFLITGDSNYLDVIIAGVFMFALSCSDLRARLEVAIAKVIELAAKSEQARAERGADSQDDMAEVR